MLINKTPKRVKPRTDGFGLQASRSNVIEEFRGNCLRFLGWRSFGSKHFFCNTRYAFNILPQRVSHKDGSSHNDLPKPLYKLKMSLEVLSRENPG